MDAPIIATINLTSELYRSTFGDERLFFAHETSGRDVQRLNDRGETDRAKWWRMMTETFDRNTFGGGDMDLDPTMPEGQDPEKVIMDGILSAECPFKWILDAVADPIFVQNP